MYVNIATVNDDTLFLWKYPGIKSWCSYIGLFAVGLGIAYFSTDHFMLKVLYVTGSLLFGIFLFDDIEECIIDKVNDEITFKRETVFQKMLCRSKLKSIVIPISSVMNVRADVFKSHDSNQSLQQIRFVLKSGQSVTLLENSSCSSASDFQIIAEKIRLFLKLSRVENLEEKCISEGVILATDEDNTDSEEDVISSDGQPREMINLINDNIINDNLIND